MSNSITYEDNSGYADLDLGRLKEIQIGSNTFTYGYTSVNPLVQTLARPNGSVTDYLYNDPLKRLTEINNKNSAAEVIDRHAFTYNNLDLIATEQIETGTSLDVFTDGLIEYSHNNVNQLTDSTSPPDPARLYLYDDDGNMTQGYTPEGYRKLPH